MKLYVIQNYKKTFEQLQGRELTDALIRKCLGDQDAVICRSSEGKGEEDL